MRDLDKFDVKEIYQDDKDVYRALFSKDSNLLRVDIRSNISESEAAKQIEVQITRMKALFENAASPYPGEISDEVVWDKELIPQLEEREVNRIQASHFTGYLNDRLVFGACTQDQAIYRGILALFYCPNQKQLFQLEIITPRDNYETNENKYLQMLNSIGCK